MERWIVPTRRGTALDRARGLRRRSAAVDAKSISTATSPTESGELLEQRVAERTRELATLLEVSRAVASTLDLQSLLHVVCEQLSLVTGSHGAAVSLLDGDELVLLASMVAPNEVGRRVPLRDTSPVSAVITERRTITFADVLADEPMARAYRRIVAEQRHTALAYVRSLMWVPLICKDDVIGVLGASHPQPHYFTAHHVDLALAIANQAAVAIQNARMHEQMLRHAALDERQRLARELHDSVSQALYGIGLGAQSALVWLERGDPQRVGESLEYVVELANAGLAEMRALIFELRPESLEQDGLVRAIERQAAALRARYRLPIETTYDEEPDVPLPVKEALYRITQEALHNTVKHAQASAVRVLLRGEADGIVVEVHDDGAGFDPTGDFPGHLGLQSMRERIERLGGTLLIDSSPGRGTRIRARTPRATSTDAALNAAMRANVGSQEGSIRD
jgi:signal transduction histidine kinase